MRMLSHLSTPSRILRLLGWAVSALFLVLLTSCAADPGAGFVGTPDAGGSRPDPPRTDAGDGPAEDTGPGVDAGDVPVDPIPDSGTERLVFVNDTDASIRLLLSSSVTLQARYLDERDEPIAGARIEFEILGGDPRGSRLRETSNRTSEEGIAEVTLLAGDRDALFNVRARVDGRPAVNTLTFQVTVRTKESADYVFVNFYDEATRPLRLTQVEYLVFTEPLDCARLTQFPGSRAFNTSLPSVSESFRVSDVYEPYPYENDRAVPLSGVVTLYQQGTQTVAWACNAGPFESPDGAPIAPADVEFGDEAVVNLVVQELYPRIRGRYEVENELDLFELLPPDIQGPLRTILLFFESPGRAIYQILVDTGVILPLPSGTGGLFASIIDNIFFSLLPENVRRVFEDVSDIGTALQTVRLGGDLRLFEEADANGAFGCGELVIDRVTLNINLIACETDRTLDLRGPGLTAFYGLISGGQVRIANTDSGLGYQLSLDPFTLEINYGQILLFILEDFVFPAAFGDPRAGECAVQPRVNLTEALRRIIDCRAIADGIGALRDFVESTCNLAVTTVATELRNQLAGLSADVGTSYRLRTPEPGSPRPSDVELLERGMEWRPCPMSTTVDGDGVLQSERLGGPRERRCVWDARLFSSPADTVGRQAAAAFFSVSGRRNISAGLVCGAGR
jgi:hypothetical protein